MKWVFLLGRILFSSLFIIKSFAFFSSESIARASDANVLFPSLVIPIAGILVFTGGLSILLGYKAQIGALLLIIVLVPITLLMHRFWEIEQPYHALMNQYCFLKNIALIGALLMLTYFGSGPLSLSCCSSKCK